MARSSKSDSFAAFISGGAAKYAGLKKPRRKKKAPQHSTAGLPKSWGVESATDAQKFASAANSRRRRGQTAKRWASLKKASVPTKAKVKRVTSKTGRVYETKNGKRVEIKKHKGMPEAKPCIHCGHKHKKGLHRFHGPKSYKKTHPGAPYKAMSPKRLAKRHAVIAANKRRRAGKRK